LGWTVEIFKDFFDAGGGGDFIGRYLHILFGITWIGLLYFFNVVQVPAYAQMEPGARGEALRKVTFRALWWFRYAALFTFLTGIWLLSVGDLWDWKGQEGLSISIGALLATTMFLNVWGVIWRNQKINIASSEAVAAGGEADPRAAKAANAAGRASRVNTFFSIPMLFLMVFTAHYAGRYKDPTGGKIVAYVLIALVIWAVMEASALGLIGGLDNAINKAILADHKRTIWAGVVYLLILLFIGWELIIGS
jgi:Urate oxidase N-terminal